MSGLNLFKISEITEKCGKNYDDIKSHGTICLVTIDFTCDLDDSNKCDPKFDFFQIDQDTGFNFRKVDYHDLSQSESEWMQQKSIKIFFCSQ